MSNTSFAEIAVFDSSNKRFCVRKRLRLWVQRNGLRGTSYYVAHLSHEIYKSHGTKGHKTRQEIRDDLKSYVNALIKKR